MYMMHQMSSRYMHLSKQVCFSCTVFVFGVHCDILQCAVITSLPWVLFCTPLNEEGVLGYLYGWLHFVLVCGANYFQNVYFFFRLIEMKHIIIIIDICSKLCFWFSLAWLAVCRVICPWT